MRSQIIASQFLGRREVGEFLGRRKVGIDQWGIFWDVEIKKWILRLRAE
jgi:hypothetical protein